MLSKEEFAHALALSVLWHDTAGLSNPHGNGIELWLNERGIETKHFIEALTGHAMMHQEREGVDAKNFAFGWSNGFMVGFAVSYYMHAADDELKAEVKAHYERLQAEALQVVKVPKPKPESYENLKGWAA